MTQNPGETNYGAVLDRAPPPWHTALFVTSITAIFLSRAPTVLKSIDEIAVTKTFTETLFPHLINVKALILWRFFFASVLAFSQLWDLCFTTGILDFIYYPGSKLKPTVVVFPGLLTKDGSLVSGVRKLSSFTNWSLIVESLSFYLSALVAFLETQTTHEVPPVLMRAAVMCWLMSAPAVILTSFVVKYVIWEDLLKQGKDTKTLKHPFVLIAHNFTSMAVFAEIGVLGGMPCRLQDFPLSPLFGIVFVYFSWAMAHSWAEPKHGPQFMYSFLDTTLGIGTTVAILLLLLVLLGSYAMVSFTGLILNTVVGGGLLGHMLATILLSMFVCRFQD